MFNKRLVVKLNKAKTLKPEPKSQGDLSRENVEAHIQHIDMIVENLAKEEGLFNAASSWNDGKGFIGTWASFRGELARKVSECLRKQARKTQQAELQSAATPYYDAIVEGTSVRLKKSVVLKARGLPIGTVKDWKGRKFKKVAEGKWRPVKAEKREAAREKVSAEEASNEWRGDSDTREGGAAYDVQYMTSAKVLGMFGEEEPGSDAHAHVMYETGEKAYVQARQAGKDAKQAAKLGRAASLKEAKELVAEGYPYD